MDINVVMCDKRGEKRSLEEYKRDILELFLSEESFSITIEPLKIVTAQSQLQHLALLALEKEGVVTSYKSSLGSISYFLNQEIFLSRKQFNLSLDCLISISDVYNVLIPSLMGNSEMFTPISPFEVDEPIIESLFSMLTLTIPILSVNEAGQQGGSDTQENEGAVFSLE